MKHVYMLLIRQYNSILFSYFSLLFFFLSFSFFLAFFVPSFLSFFLSFYFFFFSFFHKRSCFFFSPADGADDKPFMVDMKEMSGYEKNLYLYSVSVCVCVCVCVYVCVFTTLYSCVLHLFFRLNYFYLSSLSFFTVIIIILSLLLHYLTVLPSQLFLYIFSSIFIFFLLIFVF